MIPQADDIYISVNELAAAGIQPATVYAGVKRNANKWKACTTGGLLHISYEHLDDYNRGLVQAKYGNPHQYHCAQVIKRYLTLPPVDSDTILNYQYDGKYLPTDAQVKYLEACKYLHLLSTVTIRWVKEAGFDSMQKFLCAIVTLITADGISLPANIRRLQCKVKEYRENGAVCIVSSKFGNQNARKLEGVKLALVAQCYALHNQYGAERIAEEYNKIAATYNWKPITAQAILYNINQPAFKQQLIGPRKGIDAYRELADLTVSRMRPSRPNMLWVGDGTPFELYYRKDGTNWHRKVVYIVVDAHNDYIIGYAIGETENNALAKLAWRNACVNNGILPDQIKTDRFGLKEMRSYYSRIAKGEEYFTPSKAGNARDKIVEQFFAQIRRQVVRDYPNHSGGNVTSDEQPNRDYLNKIASEFPDEAGVLEQIHESIERWNTMPRKKLNGQSLEQQWRDGDHSKTRTLDDMQRLEIFGTVHDYSNKLTNKGIAVTIQGKTRLYMEQSHKFMDTIGTDYRIIYDELDLRTVLALSADGKLRFVLPEVQLVPMAYGDMQEGDRKRLNAILQLKRERTELNIERNAQQLSMIEAEGLHKMFPLLKNGNKALMNGSANALKQLGARDQFDDDDAGITVPVKRDKDEWDED